MVDVFDEVCAVEGDVPGAPPFGAVLLNGGAGTGYRHRAVGGEILEQ